MNEPFLNSKIAYEEVVQPASVHIGVDWQRHTNVSVKQSTAHDVSRIRPGSRRCRRSRSRP
eukprot:1067842-Rhodomonas_salina.1